MSPYDPFPNANTRIGDSENHCWSQKAKTHLLREILALSNPENSVKLPKTHKFGLALSLALLLITHTANCIVGDTTEQARARYGTPWETYSEANGVVMTTYLKKGTLIKTEEREGRIVCESYAKDPQRGERITEGEATAILELHGGHSRLWEKSEEDGKLKFSQKTKGIVALWSREHSVLLVATKSRYEEWKKSQTAP